jgi:hypothetical protein
LEEIKNPIVMGSPRKFSLRTDKGEAICGALPSSALRRLKEPLPLEKCIQFGVAKEFFSQFIKKIINNGERGEKKS